MRERRKRDIHRLPPTLHGTHLKGTITFYEAYDKYKQHLAQDESQVAGNAS
jgi:hypothetical protein